MRKLLFAVIPVVLLSVVSMNASAEGNEPNVPELIGFGPKSSLSNSVSNLDENQMDRTLVEYKSEDALLVAHAKFLEQGNNPIVVADSEIFVLSVNIGESEISTMSSDPTVVGSSPNEVIQLDGTQTSPPWGLDRIDQAHLPLDSRFAYDHDGSGTTVFVIDTGLNWSHSDFAGRVPVGYYLTPDFTSSADCNGHGTHVAGSAVGTQYGVAKGADVIPVRILDCDGATTTAALISALDLVASVAYSYSPAVLNMSLGGAYSSTVNNAVQTVINSGVTVVAAAGNEGSNACYSSPASVPAAITVGASSVADAVPWWSNYGSCLDMFAPGVDIKSASYTGSGYLTMSGTSMASPHVAGAAALILDENPTLSPAAVSGILRSDATTGVLSGLASSDPDRLLFVGTSVSAECDGKTATIIGTSSSDVISGTSGNDVIHGLGGNDVIYGYGGDDTICGGDGRDRVIPGSGDDVVIGGAGLDTVDYRSTYVRIFVDLQLGLATGSNFDDALSSIERVYGTNYDDEILGTSNRDLLFGVGGEDLLVGRGGRDLLSGGGQSDIVIGGSSDSSIQGGGGDDVVVGRGTLVGGSGHDVLVANDGSSTIKGNAGRDILVGGAGTDSLIGGSGSDSCAGRGSTDVYKTCSFFGWK